MKVGAVVLAAGKSERMGRNKLLTKIRGRTLIDRVLDVLMEARIDEVVIVLGHKPRELLEHLKAREGRYRVTINEDYERGMTSSFKVGLKLLRRTDACFLILGDQLLLEASLLKRMILKMEHNQLQAHVVSPIYQGKKGHPVLFSHKLFEDILSSRKNEIIRDVIHRHRSSLHLIRGNSWITMDIDTLEDLEDAETMLDS